jgi:hypothetical protein
LIDGKPVPYSNLNVDQLYNSTFMRKWANIVTK